MFFYEGKATVILGGGIEWGGVVSGSLATGIGLVNAWYVHGTTLLSTSYRPGNAHSEVLVGLLRLC